MVLGYEYFEGKDIDATAAVADLQRDDTHMFGARSRAAGIQRSAPHLRACQARNTGGGAVRQSAPGVWMPPNAVLDQTAAVRSGFGRYVPFTEAMPVALRTRWMWTPVPGGMRVASPQHISSSEAQQIASAPRAHGYVLVNSTFMPSALSPGDRHIMATSAAV